MPPIADPSTGPGAGLAIEVTGLCVAYGDHRVLDGVDLQVRSGSITTIVGGSGCGKTTLLKAIIGLVPAAAGHIVVLGREVAILHGEGQAALRQRLGVVFQFGALLNSLTVAENVALPLEMHSDLCAATVRDLVRTRLHQVGLPGTEDLLPTELSGGMRKRAALARALARDPEVLLCDEPGAGLDPVTAAGIDQLLLTLNRSLGMTTIVVTHELLSIRRLGGHLLMLEDGRVAFDGPADAAMASEEPALSRFFRPG